MRLWHRATFVENPDWKTKDNIFELGTLGMFSHNMFDGQLLLERSRVTEAFEHFGRAFDLIQNLLEQQVFLFLPYLYYMLLPDRQSPGQEVVSQLLNFICQMIRKRYPQLRPIEHSLALLHYMSLEDRGESSKRLFQAILNRFQFEFEVDVPDLLSDLACQPRNNFCQRQCYIGLSQYLLAT